MVGDSESHGSSQMKSTCKLPPSKFPRHEPEADLARAEQVVFEEMEHAAELLQSEEDFGRSGVRHALHACYSFLHVRGLSGQGLKPLIDLMAALENVASGALPELFDPKLKPGRLPERKWSRSHAARETKLHAAACMDALMNGGLSKDDAAARVAQHTDGWPRISKGLINPNTVTNWRDELLQQSSDNRDRKRLELRSKMLSQGPKAKRYVKEALRNGPVMVGGVRKKPNSKT
jgi:hypothetical protein